MPDATSNRAVGIVRRVFVVFGTAAGGSVARCVEVVDGEAIRAA
jgi:hypothetical protein